MKKMLCILTLITVFVVFVACNQTETTPCPTDAERSMPDENIEYTIYSDNDSIDCTCTSSASKVVSGVKFEDAGSLEFFSKAMTDLYMDENVPEFKTIEYMGEKYTGKYRHTREIQLLKDMGYMYIDRYECIIDGSTYGFEFDRDTGRLEIFEVFPKLYPEELKITVEDAVAKVKEYIKTVYGDDDLSDCIVDTTFSNKKRKLIVGFTKAVSGAKIESSRVEFALDYEGNIISARTSAYGYMDDFYRINITEKRVKAAEEALLSMLPEDINIHEDRRVFIERDTEKCYLRIICEGDDLYININ